MSVTTSQWTQKSRAAGATKIQRSEVSSRLHCGREVRGRTHWRPAHPCSDCPATTGTGNWSISWHSDSATVSSADWGRRLSVAFASRCRYSVALRSSSRARAQCLHNLSGGTGVLTLLEAQVVGAADTGERRHLFAAQTRHTASHTSNQPDVFGTEPFAPRTRGSHSSALASLPPTDLKAVPANITINGGPPDASQVGMRNACARSWWP